MRKYTGIFFLLILGSCASLHTPTPHFVPTLNKKNQFEGEAGAGVNAVSVSLAYSPLKHLSVMGVMQALPVKSKASHYQRICEMAVGTYGSRSKLLYGLNAGYGLGTYNWSYRQFNDTTAFSLNTIGNYQKLMFQLFLALTDGSPEPGWMAGISLKQNYFWDQYTSLKYAMREYEANKGLKRNLSFEPCLFVRDFFTQHFYLDLQAGMNISYDDSMFWPGQYVFMRLGIGLKL